MTNIYLGGPLFSEMEQAFNAQLANKIRMEFGDRVNLYSPQENAEINDKSGYADSVDIFEADNVHLRNADILLANLDGAVVDPGLAAEIGYYYHYNRPIIGLYSDSRQGHHDNDLKIDALEEVAESQFSYINLYVVGAVKNRGPIAQSTDEMINYIYQYLEDDARG